MKWRCYMYGSINTIDGRKVTVNSYFDGAGDVHQAAIRELAKQKDGGAPWKGDAVKVITPLGQRVIVDIPH